VLQAGADRGGGTRGRAQLMLVFLRRTFGVLDPEAKRRFIAFTIGSIMIAALEGLGVLLFVPLTEVLVANTNQPLPTSAHFVVKEFGPMSNEKVAAILAVAVLVIFVTKSIAALVLLRWATGNMLHQEARIAKRLFSHYLLAPHTFHLQRNSAELQRTLNESLLLVFRRTLPFALAAMAETVSIMAVAAVLLLEDPLVAVIAAIYFTIVGLAYQRIIGGRQRVAARKSHAETAERYQQVQEAIGAAKEISVLHRQHFFIDRFFETKLNLVDSQRLLVYYQLAPRYFLDVAFLTGAAVIAFVEFATRSTSVALASVGLFLVASFRLIPPLNRIMASVTLARTAIPAIDQVIDDLAELDEFNEQAPTVLPPALGPSDIAVHGLGFRYEGRDEKVLRDVTLDIASGDDIGIVGTSGAGKTTLVGVLLGLLDPVEGTVTIGGQPMAACRDAWQLSIGYVPQEIVLIDDTIKANITFGVAEEDVDEEALVEAIRLSQLDQLIDALPEGLETAIGEHGARISGGQRQRLGLARSLYHKPTVLMLDEATSALDSATEARIIETIESLHGSLTIITVAHRLSTLKHCDRIYFLAEGRVAAVGTFEELRSTIPEFANLVALSQIDVAQSEAPLPPRVTVETPTPS
jgi:ABC-type multidrug transport system fused ATPase/permease subunit